MLRPIGSVLRTLLPKIGLGHLVTDRWPLDVYDGPWLSNLPPPYESSERDNDNNDKR